MGGRKRYQKNKSFIFLCLIYLLFSGVSPNIAKSPWCTQLCHLHLHRFNLSSLSRQSVAYFCRGWNPTTSVLPVPFLLPRGFLFHYKLTPLCSSPPPQSLVPGSWIPTPPSRKARAASLPWHQQVRATPFRQIFSYMHATFHNQIFVSAGSILRSSLSHWLQLRILIPVFSLIKIYQIISVWWRKKGRGARVTGNAIWTPWPSL